jgi:hypothetical protein
MDAEVPISIPRIWAIILTAIALTFLSAALSGIPPWELLLTVNRRGTHYYEGVYTYSFLRSLAGPVLVPAPALLLYARRGSPSQLIRNASLLVYLMCAAIHVLAGVRSSLLAFLIVSFLAYVVHPKWRRGRSVNRLRMLATVGISIAAFYPVAIWMQSNRSLAARGQPLSLSADLAENLDLVTPSAAMFQWARTWGLDYGVSIADAIRQAPPTFLAPFTERAEFLQIVDSMNVVGAGAAVSSAAEIFVNAGWLLGPIFMLCLGLAMGRYQIRVERRADLFSLALMICLGPCFAQIFTRGYLWQSLFLVFSCIVAAWAISAAAKPRPGRARRRADAPATGVAGTARVS